MIHFILLCISFSTTIAFTYFVPSPYRIVVPTSTTTSLPYTVIKGIDDDDGPEDIDPNSVGYRNPSEMSSAADNSVDAPVGTVKDHAAPDFSEYNDDYEEKDDDLLNVDAFSSAAGGVMPGFRLTSLSEDD